MIIYLNRDLPAHQEIPVYEENWARLAHRVREAPLVILDDEAVKEKTDLKVLVDHLVPSETKVCPVLVELRERKETLVRRVQLARLALPENKDLLVPKVSKVCPEHLDQRVIKDPKVKPESLDHPVHPARMELM